MAMEMEVITLGTPVNTCEDSDIMSKVKNMADILIPLHEPGFALLILCLIGLAKIEKLS